MRWGGAIPAPYHTAPLEEPVEAPQCLLLHAGHDVGVDVEGDVYREVPEHPGETSSCLPKNGLAKLLPPSTLVSTESASTAITSP